MLLAWLVPVPSSVGLRWAMKLTWDLMLLLGMLLHYEPPALTWAGWPVSS